jgi:hypothetical protein
MDIALLATAASDPSRDLAAARGKCATVPAAFFLAALAALELEGVRLEDL